MSHDGQHAPEHPFAGGHPDARSQAELAGFIAGCTEASRRVLDIGCGTGGDVVFLAQQGLVATGIDARGESIELARARALQRDVDVTWLHGDVLEHPFDAGSFDLVLDHGCLHHIPAEDHERYAGVVEHVLRPGGTLFLRERNHAGHDTHAISEDTVRTMFTGAEMRIRSINRYRAPRSHASSMLAVIERA